MITGLDPNTALVLIDFQQGVLKIPALLAIDTVVANTNKLIAAFRKANLPIVVVKVMPVPPTRVIRRDIASMGGAGFTADMLAIIPALQVQPDDIQITKHSWSAFQGTALHEELTRRGVTGLVMTGVATSRGVESTARAASELGYNLAFSQDAMSDNLPGAHENSLTHIFPRLGEVGDTDAIIAALGK